MKTMMTDKEEIRELAKEYNRIYIYIWTMNHLDYKLSDFADKEDYDGQ